MKARAEVRPEIWLALASVAGSFLVYLPFLSDMAPVYRFWDGPNYLTVARTLYAIRPDNALLAYVHDVRFFASYLPFYPLCVRALAFVGYERALLLVSVLASMAAVLIFYRLARDVWKLSSPGFLALVFLFLPPRWVLYRSTGATEALYIASTLGAVWFFEKAAVGRAAVAGTLAALTRISGLMIAPAFGVVLLVRRRWRSIPWLFLIPAGLFGYFAFCAVRFGDFYAYFTPHGEKLARFVPFGFLPVLFSKGLYHQVEFHILLALVYAVGTARLRPFPVIFSYCCFELALHLLLSTEDWSRYFLSMAPFALIVGFRDLIDTKAFRWMFPVFAALSIYYAWGVIPLNGCRPDIYLRLLDQLGLLAAS
ncbi:MAG TPA: hypothetical protein VMN82_16275 [Thermoanaerobaculia bacterium]|nr:hypothetical protein [Thermoanaerobaculia bacterium]